jgi:hypothetical protein
MKTEQGPVLLWAEIRTLPGFQLLYNSTIATMVVQAGVWQKLLSSSAVPTYLKSA